VVWDLETRGVASWLQGEEPSPAPVVSVAWSRNGRRLLACHAGGALHLWDVASGARERSVHTGLPLAAADLHPRELECVVSTAQGFPALVDLDSGALQRLAKAVSTADPRPDPERAPRFVYVACYAPGGRRVVVASSRGMLSLLERGSGDLVAQFKALGVPAIRSVMLSGDGASLLLVCGDRSVRMVDFKPDAPGPTAFMPVGSFEDHIENKPWAAACFCKKGREHYVVATGAPDEHVLYVVETRTNTVERVLQGPREGVKALVSHPTRPLVITLSSTGDVYFWTKRLEENWSSFAPDFKELKENAEYVEREDEFDVNPREPRPANGVQASVEAEAAQEWVDILNGDAPDDSFSDAEDFLDYIPARPQLELPAVEAAQAPAASGGALGTEPAVGQTNGHVQALQLAAQGA